MTRTARAVRVLTIVCVCMVAGSLGVDAQVSRQDPREVPQRGRTAPAVDGARAPVLFEENRGQTAKSVRYLARGRGFNFILTDREAVLALARTPVAPLTTKGIEQVRARQPLELVAFRMRFSDADPRVKIAASDRRRSRVTYPPPGKAQRRTRAVRTFGGVRYAGLYPRTHLTFRAAPQGLSYRFDLAPGADPAAIALTFDGAERVVRDKNGDLLVTVGRETVRFGRPLLYQWRDGRRHEIDGRYSVRGTTVGFEVGKYDRRQPLVIDPDIVFATAIGGLAAEGGLSVPFPLYVSRFFGETLGLAVREEAGIPYAYVAGGTQSADFPPPGTTQYRGGWDGFVQKLDVSGTLPTAVNTVYLGGDADDIATDVALGNDGAVFVTGLTASGDPVNGFGVQGALQPTYGGGDFDAFLARLDSNLAIESATFYGGPDIDLGYALAVVSEPSPAAGVYLAGTVD